MHVYYVCIHVCTHNSHFQGLWRWGLCTLGQWRDRTEIARQSALLEWRHGYVLRMCMYGCMCICMCKFTCVYVHTLCISFIFIYIYIHTHTCIYIYIYIHTCTVVAMESPLSRLYVSICVSKCICLYTKHTRIHTYAISTTADHLNVCMHIQHTQIHT
jgi:hypothetical protein